MSDRLLLLILCSCWKVVLNRYYYLYFLILFFFSAISLVEQLLFIAGERAKQECDFYFFDDRLDILDHLIECLTKTNLIKVPPYIRLHLIRFDWQKNVNLLTEFEIENKTFFYHMLTVNGEERTPN